MSDKKLFPTQPSMVGKKVYLRPATSDDVKNFHYWRLQAEPQSISCRPLPFRTAAEDSENYKKMQTSLDRQSFAIVNKDDKTLLGKISFFDYNNLNRSAEVGLMIDPDEQKNGYGSDAMKILCKFLFRYRGLNKVYAQTSEFNEGSVSLLENLGFKKDGTLRDHRFYNGEFHNDLIYSLLLFELEW